MLDLQVVDDAAAATAMLDPIRAQILSVLVEPGSATTVAKQLGEPRQKVNYHLRTLEGHGLVRLIDQRQRRGLTERVVVASARSYVLSPALVGEFTADPESTDRLSMRYLIALGARIVREVAELAQRAGDSRQTVATLAIDTEVRFASATDRAAFAADLSHAVTSLVARYHDEGAPGGRWHRLVVAAHPLPARSRPRAERQDNV